jgi:hypothetical protein
VKENEPLGTARDADTEAALRVAAPVPFRIVALRHVTFGSKTAEFSVETPLGVIEADLFTPQGREPFVAARSVRDRYCGEWRRTVALDRAFAARILDALRAQPLQPKEKRVAREPHRPEPSAALLKSEQRFDDASADLEGEDGAP